MPAHCTFPERTINRARQMIERGRSVAAAAEAIGDERARQHIIHHEERDVGRLRRPRLEAAALATTLLLAGCAGMAPPGPDPELEFALLGACADAAGTYPPDVGAELRAICDPDTFRSRTDAQLMADIDRVGELTARRTGP